MKQQRHRHTNSNKQSARNTFETCMRVCLVLCVLIATASRALHGDVAPGCPKRFSTNGERSVLGIWDQPPEPQLRDNEKAAKAPEPTTPVGTQHILSMGAVGMQVEAVPRDTLARAVRGGAWIWVHLGLDFFPPGEPGKTASRHERSQRASNQGPRQTCAKTNAQYRIDFCRTKPVLATFFESIL